MAVVDATACVADVHGLSVYRITDTGEIILLSHLPTPGIASDVVATDTRAFVADGSAGIAFIDISRPETPILLGHRALAEPVRNLWLSEDVGPGARNGGTPAPAAPRARLLAAAGGQGYLAVLALDGPAPSTQQEIDGIPLRELRLSGSSLDAAWVNSDLIVANYANGLFRLATSGPRLEVLWQDTTQQELTAVAVRGRWLFTTASDGLLRIWDCTRSEPQEVTTLDLPQVALDIDLAGRYAVLITRSGAPSMVVDILDPRAPRIAKDAPVQVRGAAPVERDRVLAADASPALTLMVLGDAPAVLDTHPGAVAGVLAPYRDRVVALGHSEPEGIRLGMRPAFDARVQLRVFRAGGDPSAPRLEAQRTFGEDIRAAIQCSDALCVLEGEGRLCAIDPLRVEQSADRCVSLDGHPMGLAVQRATGAVWIGTSAGDLYGVEPGRALASFPVEERSHRRRSLSGLALQGSLLIAIDGHAGLVHLFSMETSIPRPVGFFVPQAPPSDLLVNGDAVLLAEPLFGLQAISIESPEAPGLLVSLPMEEGPVALDATSPQDAAGNVRVAVALRDAGVALWSWDGAAGLRMEKRWDTFGDATDVAILDRALWVADGTSVLRIPLDAANHER